MSEEFSRNQEGAAFESVAALCGDHLSVSIDVKRKAFWFLFHPHPVPCFNPGVLREILAVQRALIAAGCRLTVAGEPVALDCIVVASRSRGVFNLGGDLELFCQLIEAQDKDALFNYARDCIDTIYHHLDGYGCNVATVSLVQGLALGGGFECALASETIIAEEQAEFGLPELMFNLFPGMGAFNLLSTRVDYRVADALVLAASKHSASEMKDKGVITEIVPQDTGVNFLNKWIPKHAKSRALLRKMKRVAHPVTYDELLASITSWVDAAMTISPKDMRVIQVLRKRQTSSYGSDKE